MRQTLHKSTIGMLPDPLPLLERVEGLGTRLRATQLVTLLSTMSEILHTVARTLSAQW